VVTATAGAVFGYLARDPLSDSNSLVVASSEPLSGDRLMLGADSRLAPDLRGPADAVGSRLGAPLRGGAVYTDDRAPVEWLTDLSIARYALGRR
jgi:hypothetical protein